MPCLLLSDSTNFIGPSFFEVSLVPAHLKSFLVMSNAVAIAGENGSIHPLTLFAFWDYGLWERKRGAT